MCNIEVWPFDLGFSDKKTTYALQIVSASKGQTSNFRAEMTMNPKLPQWGNEASKQDDKLMQIPERKFDMSALSSAAAKPKNR